MEEDLGVALFNRSTRHNHLTEGGKIFYERATAIWSGFRKRNETSSLNTRPQGILHINIPTSGM